MKLGMENHGVIIGSSLFQRLTDDLAQGKQVAIIGPAFAGKAFLLEQVAQRLQSRPGWTAKLLFLDDLKIISLHGLMNKLGQAVKIRPPQMNRKHPNVEDGADLLYKMLCQAACHGPLVLLVHGIEVLSIQLSSMLLQAFDLCAQDPDPKVSKRLGIAVAGSADFLSVVVGENSPFHYADRILVTGTDQETFLAQMDSQIKEWWEPGALSLLWRITGGRVTLAQEMLRWVSQMNKGGPVTKKRFIKLQDQFVRFAIDQSPVIQSVFTELERDPKILNQLVHLLRKTKRRVSGERPMMKHLPLKPLKPEEKTRLVLTGAFVSKEANRFILWPTLVEKAVRRSFTDLHVADAYSRHREWETAFEFYTSSKAERLNRPIGGAARARFEKGIPFVHDALFRSSNKNPIEVLRFFGRVVYLAAAMDGVTFWRWLQVSPGKYDWVLLEKHPVKSEAGIQLKAIRKSLPTVLSLDDDQLFKFSPDKDHLEVTLLVRPSSYEDPWLAVHMTRRPSQRRLHSHRVNVLRDLCRTFVQAYRQACLNDHAQNQLDSQKKEFHIFDEINQKMLQGANNVKAILELAANRMVQKLKYRRIMFSLVNEEEGRIQGVVEGSCVKGQRKTMAEMTNWPLHPFKKDVQAYVVHKREPVVFDDLKNHDFQINPLVIERFGVIGAAVIPMIAAGRVIGTIHIERTDQRKPEPEEVGRLQILANQMALVLLQTERLHLTTAALNNPSSATVITDNLRRIQYADEHASAWLGVSEGWRSQAESCLLQEVCDSGKCPVSGEQSIQKRIQIDTPSSKSDLCLTASPIRGWHKQVMGYTCRFNDISPFVNLIDATRRLSMLDDPDQIRRRVIDELIGLGYTWARFYTIVVEKGERVLKSRFEQGLNQKQHKKQFASGQIVQPEWRDNYKYRWLAVTEEVPLTFRHDPNLSGKNAYLRRRDPLGLPEIIVRKVSNARTLEKPIGSQWVDVPLVAAGQPQGKITVNRGQDFSLMDWEILRIFSDYVAWAIALAEQRDRRRKFLSTVTHDLKSPAVAIAEICRQALENGSDQQLDLICSTANDHVNTVNNLSDRFLLGVNIDPSAQVEILNVCSFLQQIGGLYGPKVRSQGLKWSVKAPNTLPEIIGERVGLKLAVGNAIDNALRFTQKGHITIYAKAHGSNVRIRIQDTGCGMGTKMLKRVRSICREPLAMARDPLAKQMGRGFFAMAESLQRCGGQVTVQSRIRKGTRIEFSFLQKGEQGTAGSKSTPWSSYSKANLCGRRM